jgi:hypothetical protein
MGPSFLPTCSIPMTAKAMKMARLKPNNPDDRRMNPRRWSARARDEFHAADWLFVSIPLAAVTITIILTII